MADGRFQPFCAGELAHSALCRVARLALAPAPGRLRAAAGNGRDRDDRRRRRARGPAARPPAGRGRDPGDAARARPGAAAGTLAGVRRRRPRGGCDGQRPAGDAPGARTSARALGARHPRASRRRLAHDRERSARLVGPGARPLGPARPRRLPRRAARPPDGDDAAAGADPLRRRSGNGPAAAEGPRQTRRPSRAQAAPSDLRVPGGRREDQLRDLRPRARRRGAGPA